MPQLDPSSYPSQIFWLVVTFIPLFFILWKVALPKVGQVIDARRARIEGDLDRATALREEAGKVLGEYEKALAEAHEKARAEIRKAGEEMAALAARRHAELGSRLAEEIRAGEGRIAAARDAALANIRGVAAEAAAAATERLIGVKVSGDALSRATAADEERR